MDMNIITISIQFYELIFLSNELVNYALGSMNHSIKRIKSIGDFHFALVSLRKSCPQVRT